VEIIPLRQDVQVQEKTWSTRNIISAYGCRLHALVCVVFVTIAAGTAMWNGQASGAEGHIFKHLGPAFLPHRRRHSPHQRIPLIPRVKPCLRATCINANSTR